MECDQKRLLRKHDAQQIEDVLEAAICPLPESVVHQRRFRMILTTIEVSLRLPHPTLDLGLAQDELVDSRRVHASVHALRAHPGQRVAALVAQHEARFGQGCEQALHDRRGWAAGEHAGDATTQREVEPGIEQRFEDRIRVIGRGPSQRAPSRPGQPIVGEQGNDLRDQLPGNDAIALEPRQDLGEPVGTGRRGRHGGDGCDGCDGRDGCNGRKSGLLIRPDGARQPLAVDDEFRRAVVDVDGDRHASRRQVLPQGLLVTDVDESRQNEPARRERDRGDQLQAGRHQSAEHEQGLRHARAEDVAQFVAADIHHRLGRVLEA